MRFRATFDGAGDLTGLYTDLVHGPDTLEDGSPNPDRIPYPAGSVEIAEAAYIDLLANPNLRRWDGAAVVPYAPPPPPTPPREQVGAVFLRAVVDLGWWDLFEAGAAHQGAPVAQGGAGKPYDQRAWTTIGKTDRVMVLDAPLGRVARAAEAARVAASGQPAPAQPVVTLAAVMDRGDAMAG